MHSLGAPKLSHRVGIRSTEDWEKKNAVESDQATPVHFWLVARAPAPAVAQFDSGLCER